MNKDDSEPKPSDKFIVENSLLTQKTKPQKEKKLPKVASPTPKKIKKKSSFFQFKRGRKRLRKRKNNFPKSFPNKQKKPNPITNSQKNRKRRRSNITFIKSR